MQAETIQKLLEINRSFYRCHAASFASTRRRVQPGVYKALKMIPREGSWLDLGCGTGVMALEMRRLGFQGLYVGVDSSIELLEDAIQASGDGRQSGLRAVFCQGDLSEPGWAGELKAQAMRFSSSEAASFQAVLAFAVLHHLPGSELRKSVLVEIRTLLNKNGLLIHSNWQFKNSPRLARRVQPWLLAGLKDGDVDPGDALLDWRGATPGEAEPATGLRYVHLFNRTELAELARETGFEQVMEYESDGHGGRLGLYQVWRPK